MNQDNMDRTLEKKCMLTEANSLLLGTNSYTQKDYHSVRQSIAQFENRCIADGYERSEVDDARFFLCAFLDEQVFRDQSLLSTWYGPDANKDHEFFDRLARRQDDSQKSIDLLELAYLCLSLGFRGKFHQSPHDNDVITIMDSLYSDIRDTRDTRPNSLSIGQTKQEKRSWRYPPIWITAIVTLIILLSILISYNKKLNAYIAPVLDTIHNMGQADNSIHEN